MSCDWGNAEGVGCEPPGVAEGVVEMMAWDTEVSEGGVGDSVSPPFSFFPLPKNVDSNFCLCSSQNFAAIRGGSAGVPSEDGRAPRTSDNFVTVPSRLVISSWRSTKTGQWSLPLICGWMSAALIQGTRPGVMRMKSIRVP